MEDGLIRGLIFKNVTLAGEKIEGVEFFQTNEFVFIAYNTLSCFLNTLENRMLMSEGKSWVSFRNCPDSQLELPNIHTHTIQENNNS